MNRKQIIAIVVIWIVTGALSYGICLGHEIEESHLYFIYSPCYDEMGKCGLYALGGPVNLIVQFFITGFANDGIAFVCNVIALD